MTRTLPCLLALGLLLVVSSVPARGEAQPAPGNFREVAEQRLAGLEVPEVPGLAYAVVGPGAAGELGASGVLRLGGDEPVTPDTPFVTGSISKSFTALAVMQLAEAGKLSLDDPLSRHLPAFAQAPSGAVTVRQLLSHTSGFSTFQGHVMGGEPAPADDAIERQARWLATVEPAYPAGQRWAYSNANYQLLGRLVEVLAGEPFGDYVERRILAPIGMQHSFVADGARHAGMAVGHRPWFGNRRPVADETTDAGTAPQGGVVASAGDLARYMRVMMNGRDDIVSAAAKAEMLRPAGDAAPFYGFGWFVDTRNGTAWHSGSSPGVETLLTLVPGEGRGVVVLVNAGSGVGFGETAPLRDGITAAALGRPFAGAPARWGQKITFVCLVLLPLGFALSIAWAWRHRSALRAKARSGPFGLFSLWFPLLTTLAAAWVLLWFVPRLLGVPLPTLRAFQPDLALAMIAGAVTGVLWALTRLVLAYGRRTQGA